MDKGFYTFNNIRKLLWNARAHWLITKYNHLRLKEVGEPALHLGVAPTEDDSVQFVETTKLLLKPFFLALITVILCLMS